MRLKDKVAVITGGAEGIGKAYALGYAAEGARVVLADINLQAAEELANTMTEQGNEVLAIKTDVSEVADTEEMVRKALERFGRIDILVNNAASFQRPAANWAPVWELEPAEWERVIKVNLTGVFLCCRAVLPSMIKQQSGKIINIASDLGFRGAAEFSHYSTSKGGVITFTRSLAREVGEYNINVNTICPGFTLSMGQDPQTNRDSGRDMPGRILKRPEYPEDLVGTAIYLASSDSDFMTGQALVVDGGVMLH
ncbi:SDR family NAD(P)-dependent oxidoreductase [Chloroflexota bacterium]